jgi:FkbM family methyltransferase
MAFGNAKRILQSVSGLAALKLLLLTARSSRPALAPLCALLLRPFSRAGEIPIRYHEAGRDLTAFLRESDLDSDLHSMLEVVVRKVYPLDPAFAPDLVIDGGGNTGLFTLLAAAAYPSAKIAVCEPLPRNIAQIERHLAVNRVAAEILPVCIGGSPHTIPFYCRDANSSSFDPEKPFDSVLQIPVLRLSDILADRPAEKILIKLDIEGMEIEALESYVPGETRPVVVLGELHGHLKNRAALEQLFAGHNWSIRFGDLSGGDTMFTAISPAAHAFGPLPPVPLDDGSSD